MKKEIWRSGGTVKQDSTEDNLKSTSGETFAFAQAKLAAGAMNRSERFAIGGTSVNAVRDVETGAARIEATNSNVFSDGNQVNHNHGMSIKNPLQYAAKHATGADATKMGTDDGDFLDNVSGGLVHATSFGGGLIVADQVFNEGKAFKATKRWVKGDVNVGGDWYSKRDVSTLEREGIIEKGENGSYGYKEGKSSKEGRAVVQESLSRPTVSVSDPKNSSSSANVTTEAKTKAKPPANNSNMESPLKNIYTGKYTTITGNNTNKKLLPNNEIEK